MSKTNYWAMLLPNRCYHIYNHAIGTESLFKVPRNYDFFLERWNKYISPYFSNYAYALMTNHFHFLVKAKPMDNEIKAKIEHNQTKRGLAYLCGEIPINTFYESQFANFFKSYTNAINRQEKDRYGGLFKAKFRRTEITDAENFLHYLCYIHHNGIHHNTAVEYEDYPYSSYHEYLRVIRKENQVWKKVKERKEIRDRIPQRYPIPEATIPQTFPIATNAVFKLLQRQMQTNGHQAFVEEHQRFKNNFDRNGEWDLRGF